MINKMFLAIIDRRVSNIEGGAARGRLSWSSLRLAERWNFHLALWAAKAAQHTNVRIFLIAWIRWSRGTAGGGGSSGSGKKINRLRCFPEFISSEKQNIIKRSLCNQWRAAEPWPELAGSSDFSRPADLSDLLAVIERRIILVQNTFRSSVFPAAEFTQQSLSETFIVPDQSQKTWRNTQRLRLKSLPRNKVICRCNISRKLK